MPIDPTQIGHYKIVGRIGQGAMGVVYKAHDTALGRFVAIKTISARLLSDEQYRKRFEREARSAAQLNHPNIVTVFEFVESLGQTYLVMELLQGKDLRELIGRRSLPGLEGRLVIVEQMLNGLAFAHAKGIVHRDLKPANIHVLPDGTAKLLDFGLARLSVSEMTRTGTVMGTPNYMSPEQIRAEAIDGRSDLFAVGAILFELLTGRKAFDAENMHATLFEVLELDPVPLARAKQGMPPELLAILERALEKRPELRYSSATEMGEAVRQARRALAPGPASAPSLQLPDPLASASDSVVTSIPEGSYSEVSGREGQLTATFFPTVRHENVQTSAAPALPTLALPTLERASGDTARPERTFERSATVPSTHAGRKRVLGVLSIAAVVALGSLVHLLVGRPGPIPSNSSRDKQAALRAAVVATRVQLARLDLENKDYGEASRWAEGALVFEPDNSEALAIVSRARGTLASLEAAAKDAKVAFEGGDARGAAEALSRVLAIDPRHPVAAQLSTQLNRYFEIQAGRARQVADLARLEAERAGASANKAFRTASELVKEAEAQVAAGAFAEATQRLVQASDGFGRARRSAETAAAETAASNAAARVAALPTAPLAGPAVGGASSTANASITVVPSIPEPNPAATSLVPTPAPPVMPSPSGPVPPPGSLRVMAKPWAEVSVDDMKHGRTPLNSMILAAGPHAVVLAHPDYHPLRRVVTIKSGETTTLVIDMRDEALHKR